MSAMHPSQLTAQEALTSLHTNEERGLSAADAAKRLQEHGPNRLPPTQPLNILKLYLQQFLSPLIYLLFAAAFVTYLIGEHTDALVVVVVVLLNSFIGFFQELRAEKKMRSLQKYLAPMAKVIRDGQLTRLPAEELTIGDIVLIEAGDRIPADGRLLEAYQLECDEASFTGESLPVNKTAEKLTHPQPLAQQTNMVLMGATVTAGSGRFIVTSIGKDTQIGRISELLKTAVETASPVQINIRKLSRFLLLAVSVNVAAIIAIGFLRGYPLREMMLVGVSLAVSAIPEGLPVVLTITLSIGIWRMAKQKSIIRRLDAVETLGSVDVICTDKTGTLTRGEMMVNFICSPKEEVTVMGQGFTPVGSFMEEGETVNPTAHKFIQHIGQLAMLSTDSRVEKTSTGDYTPIGDPTEVALYVLGLKAGHTTDRLIPQFKEIYNLPFDQKKRWSAKVYRHGNRYLTVVKGAPESIATLLDTKSDQKWVTTTTPIYAKQGNRIITLAYAETAQNPVSQIEKGNLPNLNLAANISMVDPLREDTVTSVAQCQASGIRVIMITGDHAFTAKHIASEIGLSTTHLVTGDELEKLSDEELEQTLTKTTVIARATPEIKMKLIQILQRHNKTVGMTGDGVNDAPALKQADIGIAMGKTGSDVAISAADMVLVDDNFSSITAAIKEGRVVWNNLRKVIFYLLSTSVAEILVIFFSVVSHLPLPLLAPQILWLNLVTDGFLDVTLATETPESEVMREKVRSKAEPLMHKPVIARLLFMGLWMSTISFIFFYSQISMGTEKARSLLLLCLAATQWFNAWNSRSEYKTLFEIPLLSNRPLIIGLLCCISLQVLAFSWKPLQNLLKTTPLTPSEWLLCIAVASTIIIGDTIWKKLLLPVVKPALSR